MQFLWAACLVCVLHHSMPNASEEILHACSGLSAVLNDLSTAWTRCLLDRSVESPRASAPTLKCSLKSPADIDLTDDGSQTVFSMDADELIADLHQSCSLKWSADFQQSGAVLLNEHLKRRTQNEITASRKP